MSVLNLFILIPFFGSFFALFFKKSAKIFSFFISLIPLYILIFMKQTILSDSVEYSWVKVLSIYFDLKVDDLSYIFLFTTCLIMPIVILAAKEKESFLFSLLLLFQGLLFVFFSTKDLALFTIFFEASLLPVFFIMILWGGDESKKAAIKFIVYMIAGSSFLVAAVLALYFSAHSFNLDVLAKTAEGIPFAPFIFAAFTCAFIVKTPMFPFHGWLSDAYTEAPLTATILLSALLSKLGIYGFFRVGLSLFPTFMEKVNPYLLPLAIFAVLYGAFAAWMSLDYKRLISYSSFSHVNFILAGLFTFNSTGHQGALLQVLNHAVTTTGLFLVASFLEEKIHSRQLFKHRGLLQMMPKLCWCSLIFVLATIALPGTNNFIGEIIILFSVFQDNYLLAACLALNVIFSAIYMLRYMELNFYGREIPKERGFTDIGNEQVFLLLPLMIIIFLIGIYPNILLKNFGVIR